MASATDSTARVVVLVSGSGSNLQALIDAELAGALGGTIVGVVSNRPDAFGLSRATAAGIATKLLSPNSGETRSDYDARLAEVVQTFRPDLVVLAGWMRLLTGAFLSRFPDRVINLHPALPGEYPGLNAIERAFSDAQAGHRTRTGITVHFVPDEGVDDGPVTATEEVPITTEDTIETLTARIHQAEHRLLPDVVARLCAARSEHVPDPRHTQPIAASFPNRPQ